MRIYFYERCAGSPKSKDFWPSIKAFLSKNGSDGGSGVILSENDKVVSNQIELCDIFNNYFVTVAKDIRRYCHCSQRYWKQLPIKLISVITAASNKLLLIYLQPLKGFQFNLY